MSDKALNSKITANDDAPLRPARRKPTMNSRRPSARQRAWLRRGIGQPGGKLPLFDDKGRSVNTRIVKACLNYGWAEPWFSNPLKPDWLVCKLTEAGRNAVK